MDLINEAITHNVFGEGSIVEQEGSIITVDFNEEIKKFVYPDAFEKFITLNDPEAAKSLEKVITKQEEKAAELERQREVEFAQQELERQRKELLKNHKIHESSQVVFWLDEDEYENALTNWEVSTGVIQSGVNEGQPNRAARLRPNSAGLITVRDEDQSETERKILGIYMVEETFAGNLSEDGIVPAHPEFRIQLTDEEAEKMLFWNYYINKNYPHRTTWNSGSYRYFDNVWTAQILKDLIALRADGDVEDIEKFLEYFCQLNALDPNDIPEADGALKQV